MRASKVPGTSKSLTSPDAARCRVVVFVRSTLEDLMTKINSETQRVLDALAKHLLNHGKLFTKRSKVEAWGTASFRQLARALFGSDDDKWRRYCADHVRQAEEAGVLVRHRHFIPGQRMANAYWVAFGAVAGFLSRLRRALRQAESDLNIGLTRKSIYTFCGGCGWLGFDFFESVLAAYGGGGR